MKPGRFVKSYRIPILVVISLLCGARTVRAQQIDQGPRMESWTDQASAQTDSSSSAKPDAGFFRRLANFYRDDWNDTAANGPEPKRRIPPAPLDSPPFPFSDWQYGGAPVIGTPDTNVYPLMQAINGARSKVKVYGWIEPSVNVTTSKHTLFPNAYNIYAAEPVLDQAVLYIERLPDTVQTDHVDWGFHLTGFYGVDYRFTTAKGWLSQQLLKYNRQYGFDSMLEYADVYIPRVADGMTIRVGRFLSVPDIEAQLAANNYMLTHSLLYVFDPFTQTGMLATVRLNDRWLVQAGLSAGNDVAPWVSDAKPSATACVSYTFNHGNDNIYPCASGINSGKFAYDNVQFFANTWYHKFNAKWHTDTEVWFMYQRDVPSATAGLVNLPPLGGNGGGAFCAAGRLKCFAPAWAAVNFLERELSKKDYLSIRNDVLDDPKGQRTGFATKYSEHTLSWGHWIGSTVLFRPELRFEHSYAVPAYDNGTKKNQFTFAVDAIFKF